MEIVKAELGGELVNNAQKDFVSGLQSLGKVVAILKEEANVKDSTPAAEVMKITKKLSLPIRQAHEYLTKSLGLWENANDKLSVLIERKVGHISSMKTNISKKVAEIERLKKRLESLSQQIGSNEEQLDEARSSLNRANERLKEQRDQLEKRKRGQKFVAGVGLGTAAVFPVFGWAAAGIGAAMVVTSLTAMEDAIKASQNSIESAEGDVRSCENLLSDKNENRVVLQQMLAQENAELHETKWKLEVLEAEVRRLREEQKCSLDVQEKLRNTCHFMTKISGKSNVLRMESLNAYSLEPLFTSLEEIAMMFKFEECNKLKLTTLLFNGMDFTGVLLKLKTIREKTQNGTFIGLLFYCFIFLCFVLSIIWLYFY